MWLFNFIKNGGLFGKMRGFDSDKEGHWYGFDEFNEDITKYSEASKKTVSIPGKVTTVILSGNSENEELIASDDSEIKRIEK